MHFLRKIFHKPSLSLVVAHLGEQQVYNMDWECLTSVQTEVKNNCMKLKVHVDAKPMFDDIDTVSISFEWGFIRPPRKVYNPVNVARNLNNLERILVSELSYNSKDNRLLELDLNQLNMVQQFCKRVLKQYFLVNESLYQHSLEALSYGTDFDYSQLINLKVGRYSVVNKDWHWFRYQRVNYLFRQNTRNTKSSTAAANDKNANWKPSKTVVLNLQQPKFGGSLA